MTDPDPAGRPYVSGDGLVSVTVGPDYTPRIQLDMFAVRLPVRELGELITVTARDAVDQARATEVDTGPNYRSAADALAGLKDLRDTIREQGASAAIQRQREKYDLPPPDRSPDDPREQHPAAPPPDFPTGSLDAAIEMLERFQNQPGGLAADLGEEGPTVSARSEDDTVMIEATGQYPLAKVLLGNHARELGGEALAELINETVASAAAELQAAQRDKLDGLGLPVTMDQVEAMPDQARDYGKKTLGQAAYLRHQHEDITRRLHEK